MNQNPCYLFRRAILWLMTCIIGVFYVSSIAVADSITIQTGWSDKPGLADGAIFRGTTPGTSRTLDLTPTPTATPHEQISGGTLEK